MKKNATSLFQKFTGSEKNAGLLLLVCTFLSLLLANSSFGETYLHFWHKELGFSTLNLHFSLEHWINDGLMTVFFLMVGLEIERELYAGELHPLKNAILPVLAAVGGMVFPALIYAGINYNTDTIRGFGIPMGTDIAFALGILALAGKRVPVSIKILLTALAIIDDLGSIIIIALFYGSGIESGYLAASFGIFILLLVLNRLKILTFLPYIFLGIIMWYFMLQSGIHPTISGVLLAFAFPFADGSDTSPSIKLQNFLHLPVAFFILPLFTLANTAIPIKAEFISALNDVHTLGIASGLLIGKPLGIILASFLVIKLKLVKLPEGVGWYDLISMGCIAGIGFTMSIFITQLAFSTEMLIQSSKLMILISSGIAGLLGLSLFYLKKSK